MSTSTRLPTSPRDQKILFARSGNLCSFPACNRQLIEPGTTKDQDTVVGQIAHIVGASRQGPRGHQHLAEEDRASHDNLILLCRDHHAIVDAQPRTYSVQVLQQMKTDHEALIEERLRDDPTVSNVAISKETLYSSLLPITHVPSIVYSASTPYNESQYEMVKRQHVIYPKNRNQLTPFLLRDGRLFTFYDLRKGSHPFRAAIDQTSVAEARAAKWWEHPEDSRRYQTLLNRALYKYMSRRGVRYDPEHRRYFFEPVTVGKPRNVRYRLQTGRRSQRGVVWQPKTRATGKPKTYWVHLAARLTFIQTATEQWCLGIRPERRITKDGQELLQSDNIGRRVTRLKARMYNDKYLKELYFWLSVITENRPRLTMELGGQTLMAEARLVPFEIQWPGVGGDLPSRRVDPVGDDLFSLADLDEICAAESVPYLVVGRVSGADLAFGDLLNVPVSQLSEIYETSLGSALEG